MDWPDVACKACFGQLVQDRTTPSAAADDRDGAWAEQAGEIASHAPRGRKRSRLMMCRWISDVPSQMRSTRASRQKRSNG